MTGWMTDALRALLDLKRAAGRPQDIADIAALEGLRDAGTGPDN